MPHRGSPSKGEQTRNAIRNAAAQAFRDRGYDAATLEDIASSLGLTRSAVLFHFGSKEDILREIVDPFFEQLDVLLDGVEGSVRNARQRRTFLTDFVDLLCDRRCVAALLIKDVTAHKHLGADSQMSPRTDRFVRLVADDDTPAGTIRALAALGTILRPVTALADHAWLDDPENRRQLVNCGMAALRA